MTHSTASSRNGRPRLARRSSVALVVALACTSLACAARDLDERDLGSTAPPLISNESAEPGERLPVTLPNGAVDPFVEGHWLGYTENLFAASGPDGARPVYRFPSGSTDFTLDIALTDIFAEGQIVFGAAAVPTPERGVPYPPGFDAQDAFPLGSNDLQLPPQEGRAYPLMEQVLRFEDSSGDTIRALALTLATNAAYQDWCALQLPRPTGDGRFDCLRYSDADDPDAHCESDGRFDCDLGALCGARNVCECTESGCNLAGGALGHIWLIRDGADLLGTFVGVVFDHGSHARFGPVGTVRFRRVNP